MSFPPPSAFTGIPVQWATATDYPAGSDAWSGTATKITPGYSYFTPAAANAPSAQEFNSILSDFTAGYNLAASGTGLLAQFAPQLGFYFPYTAAISSYGGVTKFTNARWDEVVGQWVYWIQGAGTTNVPLVFRSQDGNTWAPSTTLATDWACGGFATEPLNLVSVLWSGLDGQFWTSSNFGQTWTICTSTLPAITQSGITSIGLPHWSTLFYFNGNFYFLTVNYSAPNYSVRLWYAASASFEVGTTWTDISANLPANWLGNSATGTPDLRFVPMGSGIMLVGQVLATDHSVKLAYLTTPTAIYDVTSSFPFPGSIGVARISRGFVASSVEGKAVMCIYDASNGFTHIMSADIDTLTGGVPDASAWTIDYTFSYAGDLGGELSNCGALYFLTTANVPYVNVFGSSLLLVGLGRTQWTVSNGWGGTVTTFSGDHTIPLQLLCNGQQILGLMQKHLLASAPQGFIGRPTGMGPI